MTKEITVYVWRDGLIKFGNKVPKGAISVARGPENMLRPIVEVNAVHCWDNKSFRVGGVATADSDEEALEVLGEWSDRICEQLKKRRQEASPANTMEASHAQA